MAWKPVFHGFIGIGVVAAEFDDTTSLLQITSHHREGTESSADLAVTLNQEFQAVLEPALQAEQQFEELLNQQLNSPGRESFENYVKNGKFVAKGGSCPVCNSDTSDDAFVTKDGEIIHNPFGKKQEVCPKDDKDDKDEKPWKWAALRSPALFKLQNNGCGVTCGSSCGARLDKEAKEWVGGECCCLKGVGDCPTNEQIQEAKDYVVAAAKEAGEKIRKAVVAHAAKMRKAWADAVKKAAEMVAKKKAEAEAAEAALKKADEAKKKAAEEVVKVTKATLGAVHKFAADVAKQKAEAEEREKAKMEKEEKARVAIAKVGSWWKNQFPNFKPFR